MILKWPFWGREGNGEQEMMFFSPITDDSDSHNMVNYARGPAKVAFTPSFKNTLFYSLIEYLVSFYFTLGEDVWGIFLFWF